MTRINFIVPIRHPSKIRDIDLFGRLLLRTLSSLIRQGPQHRIMLCANPETQFPVLDPKIQRVNVDREAPTGDSHDRKAYYRTIRDDKGARVRAAFDLIEDPSEFVMVVDDDDLVHQDLARYVERHDDGQNSGFFVRSGYVHRLTDDLIQRRENFHHICGASLVIRKNRYLAGYEPTAKQSLMLNRRLGSHVIVPKQLEKTPDRLRPILFPAAVYTLGNLNSTQRVITDTFGEAMSAEGTVDRAKKLPESDLGMVRRDVPIEPV